MKGQSKELANYLKFSAPMLYVPSRFFVFLHFLELESKPITFINSNSTLYVELIDLNGVL